MSRAYSPLIGLICVLACVSLSNAKVANFTDPDEAEYGGEMFSSILDSDNVITDEQPTFRGVVNSTGQDGNTSETDEIEMVGVVHYENFTLAAIGEEPSAGLEDFSFTGDNTWMVEELIEKLGNRSSGVESVFFGNRTLEFMPSTDATLVSIVAKVPGVNEPASFSAALKIPLRNETGGFSKLTVNLKPYRIVNDTNMIELANKAGIGSITLTPDQGEIL